MKLYVLPWVRPLSFPWAWVAVCGVVGGGHLLPRWTSLTIVLQLSPHKHEGTDSQTCFHVITVETKIPWEALGLSGELPGGGVPSPPESMTNELL